MNQPKAPAVEAQAVAAAPAEPPRPVLVAVRLMYAGAALTAVGLVISAIAVATGENALRASHPQATAAQLHATQNILITLAIVSGLIEIGAWLLMARANRAGLKWARIAATVLLALGTWSLVAHIAGNSTATSLAYTSATWVVGLAAVALLWRKDSSAYFS